MPARWGGWWWWWGASDHVTAEDVAQLFPHLREEPLLAPDLPSPQPLVVGLLLYVAASDC